MQSIENHLYIDLISIIQELEYLTLETKRYKKQKIKILQQHQAVFLNKITKTMIKKLLRFDNFVSMNLTNGWFIKDH